MRVQRVYVVDEIRDEFVQKLVDNINALRAGAAEAHDTDLGRLTRLEDLAPLAGIVEDAVDLGATLVLGGSAREGGEPGFAPTLLTGCTEEMQIVREEVLGPILGIQSISSAEDALQQVNESEAGLIGYVFTKDRLAGRRMAERMRCGTVMVNDVLSAFATPEVPFGGLRASGMGHRHGDLGLRAMCELRHVSYDRVAMTRDAIWFPYTKRGYEAVSKAARILFRSGSPMKKLLDLF